MDSGHTAASGEKSRVGGAKATPGSRHDDDLVVKPDCLVVGAF
jgi:hypothetical protein